MTRLLIRILSIVTVAVAVVTGAGCTSPEEIRRPCCYKGVLTLARLQQISFVMTDNSVQPFDQVFKGFEPQNREFPEQFPFRKIGITGLVYDDLSVVFPEYDANQDGYIEEPELTVLYLREGAIGMGHKVSHLKLKEQVVALQTSLADVGGLVSFINENKGGMSKEAQSLFHEIAYLSTQIRQRGAEAADQTFLGP